MNSALDLVSFPDMTGNLAPTEGYDCRLLNVRQVGPHGTAYAAIELASGDVVEFRRLRGGRDSAYVAELQRRERLLSLMWHPATRRVRRLLLASVPITVVMDDGGDDTLRGWAEADGTSGFSLLLALCGVAECLSEAHHLGLHHGHLCADQIGISDERPTLDFTGFWCEASDAQPSLGSLEARAEDCRAICRLLEWALGLPRFDQACRDLSHRHAAQLRQLASSHSASLTELPELRVITQSLRNLTAVAPPLAGGTQTGTQACLVAPSSASSREMTDVLPRQDSAAEATAELSDREHPRDRVTAWYEPQVGQLLGRFRIESKLGEGGMGSVYRAIDVSNQQPVALKLLNQSTAGHQSALRRFVKEARLLAALNNPHITNLIEVCEDGELPYIALEFVSGVDLRHVLETRRRLPEPVALAIVCDVARGLLAAHQRGIVHRDIKPDNILLVEGDDDNLSTVAPPRVKLADFGVARQIHQSESLALTQAGTLLGTPTYMSPEQCKGQSGALPQSDIYALGVTLFELLAGVPPFVDKDPMALAGKHCFQAPPSLRKLAPEVSEPTAAIVARCLAKRPEDRFADAGHLLRELEGVLNGQPATITLRPVLPPHDERYLVETNMVWQLQAPPELLWPYVANTERLNRAIGLPPVGYRTEVDPQRGIRRFGTIRLGRIPLTWEEHPFEWIEGQRMSVLREFHGGPFQWFVSTVELRPGNSGGTELRHRVRILPRNAIGRVIAKIQTGTKCHRSLERVYRRMDSVLSQPSDASLRDAFEAPAKLSRRERSRLEAQMEMLVGKGVPLEVANRLLDFVAQAPDQEVAKIRPVALANQLQMAESSLLDALLQGARNGLFLLEWDILCPTCRVAAETRLSLKQLEPHTHCEACDLDFQSDLAGSVELVFRVHPDFRATNVGKYCIGGPWHAPHVVAQLRMEPGERIEVELKLTAGAYILRGPRLTRSFPIRAQSSGAASYLAITLAGDDEDARIKTVREGNQTLVLQNPDDVPHLVRLERTIPREDIITAARASATPRFRELFPAEVLESGRLVNAEQVTMLAASIPAMDQLFVQCGDAIAFALVEEHVANARLLIQQHGGDVVKVMGDAVFASFPSPLRAVQAAFALDSRHITKQNAPTLVRAIGIHAGPALITTSNNRLDYFGITARQTMALPQVAGAGVALTEPVLADSATAQWIAEHQVRSPQRRPQLRRLSLPGAAEQIVQVFPND